MITVRKLLDRIIQFFCCSIFLLMVIVASWQVISRYVLNSPSTVSESFLKFSLVWLSLIAIAYVAGQREHVSLTLLTDRLDGILKHISNILIELFFIAFAAFILLYGGTQSTLNTMSQVYPMLQVPKGLLYLSLPVSGAIIIIYCLLNISDIVKSPKKNRGVTS
ncbi:TRAP transporter small permease [Litchfieldella xinjiangensis]|uniref:TRAP transporter small permease n=1 Tax=Litchfieldella xinjiangensis TaxID=1166948 RepID=UPI0005BDCFC8|nr:TRAP transporter small permease [Halomonas xinjiangensis]